MNALLDSRDPRLNRSSTWLLLRRSAARALSSNVAQRTRTLEAHAKIAQKTLLALRNKDNSRTLDSVLGEHLCALTDFWGALERDARKDAKRAAAVAQQFVDAVREECDGDNGDGDGDDTDRCEWTGHCLCELRQAVLGSYEQRAADLAVQRQRCLADVWYAHGALRRSKDSPAMAVMFEHFAATQAATVEAYWDAVDAAAVDAVRRMLELMRSVLLINSHD